MTSNARHGEHTNGYSETLAWQPLGRVWSRLFGSFREQGLSFEWHEFTAKERFTWSNSFHPESVELCLNIAGEGNVQLGNREAAFGPHTAGFYCRAAEELRAWRQPAQRHQFLTVEFSFGFLREHLRAFAASLNPLLAHVVGDGEPRSGVAEVTSLTTRQHHLLQSLREPPVLAAAQPLWYRTKALELAAECFFVNPGGTELFCQRQKRMASDRVHKVQALLQRDLANPPPLEDIGRAVGCSAFHLSRTFSQEVGMTIAQYSRKLRLERAADLLKTGKHNVTEVAFQVGYSSLSHFSSAFHEMFGCCPGLYPLNPAGKNGRNGTTNNPR